MRSENERDEYYRKHFMEGVSEEGKAGFDVMLRMMDSGAWDGLMEMNEKAFIIIMAAIVHAYADEKGEDIIRLTAKIAELVVQAKVQAKTCGADASLVN